MQETQNYTVTTTFTHENKKGSGNGGSTRSSDQQFVFMAGVRTSCVAYREQERPRQVSMDEPLPKIVLDPWTERTSLSAYDGGGRRMSPERAYAGMPADARLAAAICDSAISNQWGWAASVLMIIIGEREPSTSTRTQKFFEKHKWRNIEDVYDAAQVSKNQRMAFNFHLAGFTHREIGKLMDLRGENPTHAAQMQVIRALDKLKRLIPNEEW